MEFLAWMRKMGECSTWNIVCGMDLGANCSTWNAVEKAVDRVWEEPGKLLPLLGR